MKSPVSLRIINSQVCTRKLVAKIPKTFAFIRDHLRKFSHLKIKCNIVTPIKILLSYNGTHAMQPIDNYMWCVFTTEVFWSYQTKLAMFLMSMDRTKALQKEPWLSRPMTHYNGVIMEIREQNIINNMITCCKQMIMRIILRYA